MLNQSQACPMLTAPSSYLTSGVPFADLTPFPPKQFVSLKALHTEQAAVNSILEVTAFQGWEERALEMSPPLPIHAGIH